MTPRVTVVIVNFNAGAGLARCLESVRADLRDVSWHAVIVDNASRDGSADGIDRQDPEHVTLIRNAVNRGFGAAVNQAAQQSRSPLLWLLNPDCRVRPGAFAALEETLARHETCAI